MQARNDGNQRKLTGESACLPLKERRPRKQSPGPASRAQAPKARAYSEAAWFRLMRPRRRFSTLGGTSPVTSPPKLKTSFSIRELTNE